MKDDYFTVNNLYNDYLINEIYISYLNIRILNYNINIQKFVDILKIKKKSNFFTNLCTIKIIL